MQIFKITGQTALRGEVTVSGAKNAALPIMAASVMTDETVTLENVPFIADTQNLVTILRQMSVKVDYLDRHTLRIDPSGLQNGAVDSEEVRKMRASYYLLGALLGRFHEASVAMPGGCNFGTRPIDQHIKAFEALGAQVEVEEQVVAKASALTGNRIFFDMVSVGATINAMLAAVLAEGTTIIENAAKEPHIVDTASFLNSMGADIKGAGTDIIRIHGVTRLHGSEYCIIPDQIEAGTYMVAAAATHGDVTVNNVIPRHMDCISAKLREMGITVENGENSVHVDAERSEFKPIMVMTQPYPGFPTDMQPQIMALLSITPGDSVVNEAVYDDRFRYIPELVKMGASINVSGRMAFVKGVKCLQGARVTAMDLRAGAAMVIAGLVAEGETLVDNIHLIDRGYEKLAEKLMRLGAGIERIEVEA